MNKELQLKVRIFSKIKKRINYIHINNIKKTYLQWILYYYRYKNIYYVLFYSVNEQMYTINLIIINNITYNK